MARVVLNPIMVDGFNKAVTGTEINEEKLLSAAGAEISVAQDHLSGLLLVFKGGGGSACTVKIKAGNGVLAGADMDVVVETGATVCVCPESGRFKNMSGTDKGKIILESDGDGATVRAYLLPLK